MTSVGIAGASGYMGGEALRVLLGHPEVELAWASSRSPGPAEAVHRNLCGSGVELIHPDEATPCDLVFLALPTGAAVEAAQRWLAAGSRVIDLGAAFRLRDRGTWERVYGTPHPAWELAREAVYGISELHGAEIARARLVANPGCFSSAAILGLAPLLRAGWIDTAHIVVDGLSGSAGMGAELSRVTHHAELGNNLIPYHAVAHRHTFEMEQELSLLAGSPVPVCFTPVYVPIVRGVLDLCHAFPTAPRSRTELLDLYRDFYAEAPFVHVYDQPVSADSPWRHEPYPWVSAVAGTNHCQIGVDVDPDRGRIVILSALDSLGKGGAQVAVENMNLMCGLARTAGLVPAGLHPA